MARTITEVLYFKNLTATFPIFPVKVADGEYIVPFDKALDEGDIYALIVECANDMHGGNVVPVIARLIENCQSKVCTDKTRKNSGKAITAIMDAGTKANERFLAWLLVKRDAIAPQKDTVPTAKRGAAHLSYAQIDELDWAELERITKGPMASYKSKNGIVDDGSATPEELDFLERYAYAIKRRNALKGMSNETATLVDKLQAKLDVAKGKASQISNEELQALLDAISGNK